MGYDNKSYGHIFAMIFFVMGAVYGGDKND